MTNEKEVEHLAQIFANKRHSSIEWGRECARIVIEAGYRLPLDGDEIPAYNLGWNNAIDACKKIVKAAGAKEVRYPEKKDADHAEHTCKEGCPGCNCEGANAAIDEMKRLNGGDDGRLSKM